MCSSLFTVTYSVCMYVHVCAYIVGIGRCLEMGMPYHWAFYRRHVLHTGMHNPPSSRGSYSTPTLSLSFGACAECVCMLKWYVMKKWCVSQPYTSSHQLPMLLILPLLCYIRMTLQLSCGHSCPLTCHPGACADVCRRRVTLRCPCKRLKKVSILFDFLPVFTVQSSLVYIQCIRSCFHLVHVLYYILVSPVFLNDVCSLCRR